MKTPNPHFFSDRPGFQRGQKDAQLQRAKTQQNFYDIGFRKHNAGAISRKKAIKQ